MNDLPTRNSFVTRRLDHDSLRQRFDENRDRPLREGGIIEKTGAMHVTAEEFLDLSPEDLTPKAESLPTTSSRNDSHGKK